jgi:hypothetical protein
VALQVEDESGLLGHDQLTVVVRSDGERVPRIVSRPGLEAVAGQPYAYDPDGKASAQGSRPLWWDVGKMLDGRQVNAPEGLLIDGDSGAVTWTPTAAQVGEQRVTLKAHNAVGTDLQEFTVTVAAGAPEQGDPPDADEGCGCAAQQRRGGWTWLIIVSIGLARRRRRPWRR